VKLDFGCGPSPREGYEGVDRGHFGQEWVLDVQEYPWPWEDGQIEEAYSSHCVEHLPDLVGFMREAHRVLAPGAEFSILHPYQFNVRAWQDPTHVRCINEVSWFYFDKKWRASVDNHDEYGDCDFEVVDITAIPDPQWLKLAEENPEEFEKAAHNFVNVIMDLRVQLRCRK
jgi:SAM-dependent methyltransferase